VGLDSHLAVRTFSSTVLLEVRAEPTTFPSGPGLDVNELATIMRADVGDKHTVDVKLHSEALNAILVNEYGGVYKCTFGKGKKIL
jgi:hypothetical protein